MTGRAGCPPLSSCCPQNDLLQGVYNSVNPLPFNHQLFVLTVTRNRADFSAQGC